MMKMVLSAALLMPLIAIASGQDSRLPEASLNRELDLQPGAAAHLAGQPHRTSVPPSYCKPCLFYAGDFDSNASDANGLANEFDVIVSTGAATYAPFVVPKGKTWSVTGLFTNNNIFPDIPVLDPPVIPYEVRKGIPKNGGNGGALVCHGRKHGTLTLSQEDGELYVYATQVRNIKGCRLRAGKYWMSVIPYCTNTNDNTCEASYRAFLMNDDGAMAHRFGPLEPANDAFFNSAFFGYVWEPSSTLQTSSRFSIGIEGTEK